MIKRIIPYWIKVRLHLIKRRVLDIVNGHYFSYAKKMEYKNNLPNTLLIKQELKPNEAKKGNLLIAIQSIESIQVNPNEIFSFWEVIGNPSQKRGFANSRSIVNGKVEDSIGGGLCQLSGLVYYVSLYANLEILERHSHSMDIYTAETRFTPLGSDATVAFGYKDLKIRNNLKSPIRFRFYIEGDNIEINLMHASSIEKNNVDFRQNEVGNTIIEVDTVVNKKIVNKSQYKRCVPNNNNA